MTARHHSVSPTLRPDVITNDNYQQHADENLHHLEENNHPLVCYEEHIPNHGHPHSNHHHHDGAPAFHHPRHRQKHSHNLPPHRNRKVSRLTQQQLQPHHQRQSTHVQFLPLQEVSILKILLDKLDGQHWWSQ